MHADPKITKKDTQVRQIFSLMGSVEVKAAHKHVDEIDPLEVIRICHLCIFLRLITLPFTYGLADVRVFVSGNNLEQSRTGGDMIITI